MAQETVGFRIKQTRLALGMSRAELTAQAGLSGTYYIRQIEANSFKPSRPRLERIAQALNVSPWYLETGAEDEPSISVHPAFHIESKPKERTLIQVYPDTADTLKRLAKKNGLTIAELTEQVVRFCVQSLRE